MEKFKSLSTITHDYLDGNMVGLNISYSSQDKMKVLVSYQVNKYFNLDYELLVDTTNEKVEFIAHGSHNAFDRIKLGNEPKFDLAIGNYFFPTKYILNP